MAVSSCQVVLFWLLVSGMAIKNDSSAVLLCCEGYALQCFYYPEHVLTWEGYGNWRVCYPEHV